MNRIFTPLLILLLFDLSGNAQTADFNFESLSGSFCAPARIRFNSIVTGNPQGFVWIFGNLGESNSDRPAFNFTTGGTYQVKMIAIYKKNTITVTKNITVHPGVTPFFTINRKELCTPGNVVFNINSGNYNYTWNFGDNNGSVPGTPGPVTHNYTNYGNFDVTLRATASTGCTGEYHDSVIIQKPVITGDVTPLSGCTPAIASFNAQTVLPPGSSVQQYTWNFGEGATSNGSANITHNYNQTGTYQPTVSITTNDGCSNSFSFPALAFGVPPTNLVTYPTQTTFCGSESPAFVAKATNANRYLWDFGDGDTLSVYDTTLHHKMRHVGTQTVTVTPYFNDCPGTADSFQVTIIGVIAKFNYSNTCNDKKLFSFTNTSEGNQSTIDWNINYGSWRTSDNSFVHQFPETGEYPVLLFITDSITGCVDSAKAIIYTANPVLQNNDRSICKGTLTNFEIINNYTNPNMSFEWQVIGDTLGPGDQSNPLQLTALHHGHYNNNLVIIDNGSQYCKDSIYLNQEIIVRGPVLDFDAPTDFCSSVPAIITNQSQPYIPEDRISEWKWYLGVAVEAARDTSFNPAPFIYTPYYGPINISLKATDMNGCTDSIVKTITVRRVPFLKKIPDVDTLCAGQTTTLIAFHNEPITWSPAVSCATCDTVIVSPVHTTKYVVSSTNQWNCEVKDSVEIIVHEPFTATAAKNNYDVCKGENVAFDISPKDKIITWEPSTEISNGNFMPVLNAKQSGVYIATLKDSVGCFTSSVSINVNVKSLPIVEIGPNRVAPYNSMVSLSPSYSSNVVNYEWSPAVNLNCMNCASPVYTALSSQTYTLTVRSDSGCVASDKINLFVECTNANILVPTAFTPNSDGRNDYLYPITRGIKKINHFAIYSREGVLMYEARDYVPNDRNFGWNGTYRGTQQSAATYVYVLEAICDAGETVQSKGSFVLLR